jgi:hypothetical protein
VLVLLYTLLPHDVDLQAGDERGKDIPLHDNLINGVSFCQSIWCLNSNICFSICFIQKREIVIIITSIIKIVVIQTLRVELLLEVEDHNSNGFFRAKAQDMKDHIVEEGFLG